MQANTHLLHTSDIHLNCSGHWKVLCIKFPWDNQGQDFPGGPVIKTLPSNAGGLGSIPSWGDKIPHASGPKNQNVKQKKCHNKFNKDFKNGLYIKKKKLKDNQGQLCGWSSILCCIALHSVQFSCSVVSDSLQPRGLSLPGFPVHHQLPELAQTHVHRVGDAI